MYACMHACSEGIWMEYFKRIDFIFMRHCKCGCLRELFFQFLFVRLNEVKSRQIQPSIQMKCIHNSHCTQRSILSRLRYKDFYFCSFPLKNFHSFGFVSLHRKIQITWFQIDWSEDKQATQKLLPCPIELEIFDKHCYLLGLRIEDGASN